MEIKITIENKHCTVQGTPVIVCGNSDYTVAFDFDAEWDQAGEKTARFSYVRDGARMYQDVPIAGSTAEVPAVYRTREVQVGVYAGDLVTSTPARIPCEKSIICDTCTPDDPIPVVRESSVYELIEDFTIEEDTTSFLRKVDSNGNAYNFSAVRIYIETQPCTTATSTSQLIFSCGSLSHSTNIYHQVNNALNTTARATGFIARNDCGFVEYYTINSNNGTTSGEVKIKPHYGTALPWVNIERIQLACYPSAVYIPKGTTIKIYAIRG